jgi:hypothetical protein
MKKANIIFVSELMDKSPNGIIMEAFVLQALQTYSEVVLSDAGEWPNGFISKELWTACANEVVEKIANRRSK